MQCEIAQLLGKAFNVIPGEDFNQVRYLLTNDPERPILVCEAVIPGGADWREVKETVYPALCRYLKWKRIRPDHPQNSVVALFHDGSCYLIEGMDFINAFLEIEGVDRKTFAAILSSWLDPTPTLHLPSP